MKTAATVLIIALSASSVAAGPIAIFPPVLTFPEAQADVSSQNGAPVAILPQTK